MKKRTERRFSHMRINNKNVSILFKSGERMETTFSGSMSDDEIFIFLNDIYPNK